MTAGAIIGFIIVFIVICLVTFLTLWSRRLINLIAKKKLTDMREILQEMKHEE